MAQRFGGPNSPSGDPRPKTRPDRPAATPVRVNPVGLRVNLLFGLPFLWAVSAFFRDPAGLAQNLGVFALLMLAAWLTREGVIAADAYDQRRVARRPAIPRKVFAAVLTGAQKWLRDPASENANELICRPAAMSSRRAVAICSARTRSICPLRVPINNLLSGPSMIRETMSSLKEVVSPMRWRNILKLWPSNLFRPATVPNHINPLLSL